MSAQPTKRRACLEALEPHHFEFAAAVRLVHPHDARLHLRRLLFLTQARGTAFSATARRIPRHSLGVEGGGLFAVALEPGVSGAGIVEHSNTRRSSGVLRPPRHLVPRRTSGEHQEDDDHHSDYLAAGQATPRRGVGEVSLGARRDGRGCAHTSRVRRRADRCALSKTAKRVIGLPSQEPVTCDYRAFGAGPFMLPGRSPGSRTDFRPGCRAPMRGL
jgi:hypothetical protein